MWLINQEIEPQLDFLQVGVGTAGQLVYMPGGGISGLPYGTLKGRPVVVCEQCAAPGTQGDAIVLADLSQYKIITKDGLQSDQSIHVKFETNERTFRWIRRVNGAPKLKSVITPYKGTKTLSAFIAAVARPGGVPQHPPSDTAGLSEDCASPPTDAAVRFNERLRTCTLETISAIEDSLTPFERLIDALRLGAAIRRAELEQGVIEGDAYAARIPEGSSGEVIEALLRFDELLAVADIESIRLAIAKLAEAERFTVSETRKLHALRLAANVRLAQLERTTAT